MGYIWILNFIAFSLKWHFPQLDPTQCPNLASHNHVPDSVGQARAGSVSSIEFLTHVKSSASPISLVAASSMYNIPVLVSHWT